MLANHEDFNGLVTPALKTTSRIIAEKFEKVHRDVVRAIKNLIDQDPEWGMRNFAQAPYVDGQNGQTYQMFEMTRDGYSMLVMGFTGKKAMEWKIRFLEAFNKMEAHLRQGTPTLTGPQLMAVALIEADATMKAQAAQIESMKGDVDALDRLAKSDGTFCFRDGAKSMQVRPGDLIQYMAMNRWIYRQAQNGPWLAYQDKITSGYLEHKVTTIDRSDGTEKAVTQCRITAKGLAKLAKLMGGAA